MSYSIGPTTPHNPPRHPPHPIPAPVCDHGRCRQTINDLRREVAQLEQRTDRLNLSIAAPETEPSLRLPDCPPADPASPSHRPHYAVKALGDITITPRDQPPMELPNVISARPYYLFTGALVDILA